MYWILKIFHMYKNIFFKYLCLTILCTAEISVLILLYIEIFRSNPFPAHDYSCESIIFFYGWRGGVHIKGYIFDALCTLHSILYPIAGSTIILSMIAAAYISSIKENQYKLVRLIAILIISSFIISVICMILLETMVVR